ncbi:MAG: class I tRNA ligase family protein, partial [Pseudomonadota bacterium]
GMVCKETMKCATHGFLFPEEAQGSGNERTCVKCGGPVEIGRMEKMSKSKKNVVDPARLLEQYGADTVRLFCLFASPPERDLEWNEQGVDGASRFLNRVWRMTHQRLAEVSGVDAYEGSPEALKGDSRELYRKTHDTIRRVSTDIEDRFHFNTAVSAIMELVNEIYARENVLKASRGREILKKAMETVVVLLAPIVPHMAEELWEALGHEPGIAHAPWPEFRQDALATRTLTIVVQVNGKLRSRLTVDADTDEESIKDHALEDPQVKRFIEGKTLRKVIYVPGKLVNVVV